MIAYLRPFADLILSDLDESLREEISLVLHSTEERVDCRREVLDLLRATTGELLTAHDIEDRQTRGKDLGKTISYILEQWPAVSEHLPGLTGTQLGIWRHHVAARQLNVYEWSAVREAWYKVQRGATHDRGNEVEEFKDARLDPGTQRRWYNRSKVLQVHFPPENEGLTERLTTMELRIADLPALNAALESANNSQLEHPTIHALRSWPGFVSEIPEGLRAAFRVAIRDNNFPVHLREALFTTADRLNLDPRTLKRPRLDPNTQQVLLEVWSLFPPDIQVPELHNALITGQYTKHQVDHLQRLTSVSLPASAFDREDRALLLRETQLWKNWYDRTRRAKLHLALERRAYTPELISGLRGTAIRVRAKLRSAQDDRERETRKAAVRLQREQVRAASEIRQRLLAKWRALRPQDAHRLEPLIPEVLLKALPGVCEAFRQGGLQLTIDLEKTVLAHLNSESALQSATGR